MRPRRLQKINFAEYVAFARKLATEAGIAEEGPTPETNPFTTAVVQTSQRLSQDQREETARREGDRAREISEEPKWCECKAPDGRTYYRNTQSHATTWIKPPELEVGFSGPSS